MNLKSAMNIKNELPFKEYARRTIGYDAVAFIIFLGSVFTFAIGLIWAPTFGPLNMSNNFVTNPISFNAEDVYDIHDNLEIDNFSKTVTFKIKKNQIDDGKGINFSSDEIATPMFTLNIGDLSTRKIVKFKIQDKTSGYTIKETMTFKPSLKKYLTKEDGIYKAHLSLSAGSNIFDDSENKNIKPGDEVTISLLDE